MVIDMGICCLYGIYYLKVMPFSPYPRPPPSSLSSHSNHIALLFCYNPHSALVHTLYFYHHWMIMYSQFSLSMFDVLSGIAVNCGPKLTCHHISNFGPANLFHMCAQLRYSILQYWLHCG